MRWKDRPPLSGTRRQWQGPGPIEVAKEEEEEEAMEEEAGEEERKGRSRSGSRRSMYENAGG